MDKLSNPKLPNVTAASVPTPGAGMIVVFSEAGKLKQKDSAGTVTDLTQTAAVTGTKVSAMAAASAVAGADEFLINKAGVSQKANAAQLKTFLSSDFTLSTGIPNIPNLTPVQIRLFNCVAGDNDLYTVPVGFRLFVQYFGASNPTAAASTAKMQVKIGATYYRVVQSVSIGASSLSPYFNGYAYIFEPGETVSFNSVGAGLHVAGRAFLYPDTFLLKCVRALNPAIGNTTLYTVPSGKAAQVLALTPSPGNFASGYLVNDSGATRTIKTHIVPSGGAAGLTNQTHTAAPATANQLTNIVFPYLTAGDSIVINSDAAATGLHAFAHVYEFTP
ncbi:MAG TPA: hypothetical protein VNI84_04045 [Pyrinomonadaceae bacterium]|nr:hypothetical protein [Pyrinomonadaceae bacterium]